MANRRRFSIPQAMNISMSGHNVLQLFQMGLFVSDFYQPRAETLNTQQSPGHPKRRKPL